MSNFNTSKASVVLLASFFLSIPIVARNVTARDLIAHNVEISNEIAATFHITPNHNPRAGRQTQAWFALTRRGGKSVPLSECDCTLKIYAVPRAESAQPALQPELVAIDVEKYQEIPGANIVFPQAGAYELEISGTARDGSSFSPFELTYTVNVRP